MLEAFMKICPENPNLVKMGLKYRTLYMKVSAGSGPGAQPVPCSMGTGSFPG